MEDWRFNSKEYEKERASLGECKCTEEKTCNIHVYELLFFLRNAQQYSLKKMLKDFPDKTELEIKAAHKEFVDKEIIYCAEYDSSSGLITAIMKEYTMAEIIEYHQQLKKKKLEISQI